MQHMMLYPTVSCYLNHNGNIYNRSGSPLLLSNFKNCQGHFSYQLCATLNIIEMEMDFASIRLNHAILRFPMQKYYSPFVRFENRLAVCARCFSSQASLDLVTKLTQPITNFTMISNFLSVDITDLLKEWNYREYPILQLYFLILAPNLMVQFWNEPSLSSELIIEYASSPVIPPLPEPQILSMLSVNAKKHSCTIMEPNEIIPFDTIDYDITNDITYDLNRHVFSFAHTGYYYMDWVINIRGSTTTECICIGIRNETTGAVEEFHVPNTAPLEDYGQHILHITDTSMHYSLINACDAPIQFTYAESQASLIIFKISS